MPLRFGLPRAWLAGVASALAVWSTATDAQAWYFPEHVVIAQEGFTQLVPPVQAVLADAVARARAEGLPLCEAVNVPFEAVARANPLRTRMVRVATSVDCVPYVALAALAGDHSSSAAELRTVLSSSKGIEITSAAAYEWQRFRESIDRLPNTPLERMAFVHALDVAFYFIDPGYELRAQRTRAHFSDSLRPFADVVLAAEQGDIDNAFGQFAAHHTRSLALATRGRTAEALIEHAFALHFMQDAFAAGHMIEGGWAIANERQRRRHDFYNARGLAVTRALSAEGCNELGAGGLELVGLVPCWVTQGDGYLGLSADASDRSHAARAVTKVQLQLALALDPKRVESALAAMGEREQIAIGQLMEPLPWWTLAPRDRAAAGASAKRTMRLLQGALAALDRLRQAPEPAAVTVGEKPARALFAPRTLTTMIDVCTRADALDPALLDAEEHVPCPEGSAVAVGSFGVSLLRPLLVEWPKPQADVTTLQGESKEDLGWAVQLLAAANAGIVVPPHAPVDFFAPSIGVAAGLSYRWGTYLPGRLNRSLAELNVGISASGHYDSYGRGGGNPHLTVLDQELRWPVLYELLTSYTLPFDLAKAHSTGGVVFLSGARVHELLQPAPVFFGIELEAMAIALSRGKGAYPLYAVSPELRLYVGAADPSAAQPSFPSSWGPTVGISFTGGYATFL